MPVPNRQPDRQHRKRVLGPIRDLLIPGVLHGRYNRLQLQPVHITVPQPAGPRLIRSRPEKTELPPVPAVTPVRAHTQLRPGRRLAVHITGAHPVHGVAVIHTADRQIPAVLQVIHVLVQAVPGAVREARVIHAQAVQAVRAIHVHRAVRVHPVPAVRVPADHPDRDDKTVYI
jgi:hypothetical protein